MPRNEAETRAELIDPTIHTRGWTEELVKREETAGAIVIVEERAVRQARARMDYTLRVKVRSDAQPVAVGVLEAKPESDPPAHGLEQAKRYGERLNVPWVFSTNGHLFIEHNRLTGFTSEPLPLSQFPTPEELRGRYEAALGFSLEDEAARPLITPYAGGEAARRYYQDAAIRAVFEKVARSERDGVPARALLSLATGAGKTFIAVSLLRRIADAGQLKRALFICDRDELRSQAAAALRNQFGSEAAEVYRRPDGTNNARHARVHIATYQTLDVASVDGGSRGVGNPSLGGVLRTEEDGTATFLTEHYPADYFSHIIIDECHRSAWGKWSEVLTRNPNAVQIGLTATPREIKARENSREAKEDRLIHADNLRYFGEPVYEYSITQGIEDGYLAAAEIIARDIFLDRNTLNEREAGLDQEALAGKDLRDALTGEQVSEDEAREHYDASGFEAKLLLPDRVRAMCEDLWDNLMKTGGPEQKTIIFCARDDHADRVAIALNNFYTAWCARTGHPRAANFAFKCTAQSDGTSYLDVFRGSSRDRFIATTVDLLTTGVDVPAVRNIVFFKYVKSPISFYQMVGRGTRLHPESGKLMFRIYDYTNARRLFGERFITRDTPPRQPTPGPEPPPRERTLQVHGVHVRVTDAGRYIVTDVDGVPTAVTVEEYKERLARKLLEEAPTLQEFLSRWISPEERRTLLQHLPEGGHSAYVVRDVEDMQAYDLYDVLGELGYGLQPRTRIERAGAFSYKHEEWLAALPQRTSATLRAIAGQFAGTGTEALENRQIFQVPEVMRAGGIGALQAAGDPKELVQETKARMFAP